MSAKKKAEEADVKGYGGQRGRRDRAIKTLKQKKPTGLRSKFSSKGFDCLTVYLNISSSRLCHY